MPGKQALARRCLVAPAALEVSDAPGAGSVRLLLNVPTALHVGSDCGTEPRDLGAGRHWLDFPMTKEPMQNHCRIQFRPPTEEHHPCLEVLAWR